MYTVEMWPGYALTPTDVEEITDPSGGGGSGGSGGSPSTKVIDTLTFDSNDGSCNVSNRSVETGTWLSLPGVDACSREGFEFVGWNTNRDGSGLGFAPGGPTFMTGSNTLYAQWRANTQGSGTSTPPTGAGAPSATERLVTTAWRLTKDGPPQVISGNPGDLSGRNAVFTLNTTDSARVTPSQVAQTRALAAQYGGVYGGVVTANSWRKPRVVAAYVA